ncbi:MAG: hypothetical protein HY665_05500 [Chloroflexi bacterium]|nr:hypothetical protein [Chloroflexota bacterium]
MKMRVVVLAGFILGCAAIVAAFGIGWANWGKLANQEIVMQILMGALVIVVLFLEVMAIPSKGKDRWRALTLDGVLLLGFSALVFFSFSVGWMAAPFALFLFVFSLLKLLRGKIELLTR